MVCQNRNRRPRQPSSPPRRWTRPLARLPPPALLCLSARLVVVVFRYSLDVPLRLSGFDVFSLVPDVLAFRQRDLHLEPCGAKKRGSFEKTAKRGSSQGRTFERGNICWRAAGVRWLDGRRLGVRYFVCRKGRGGGERRRGELEELSIN